MFNVHSHYLFYLRKKIISYSGNYANKLITSWNIGRSNFGTFPPFGWPLQFLMAICAQLTVIFIVIQEYIWILHSFTTNSWNKFKSSLRQILNFTKNIPCNLINIFRHLPILLIYIFYISSPSLVEPPYNVLFFYISRSSNLCVFKQFVQKTLRKLFHKFILQPIRMSLFFNRKYLMQMPKLQLWITQRIVSFGVITRISIQLLM